MPVPQESGPAGANPLDVKLRNLRRLLVPPILTLVVMPAPVAGAAVLPAFPDALSPLEGVRPVLASADLSEAVFAVARLAGVEAARVPPIATPPPPGLPASIRAPVLRLLNAVRGAEEALSEAVSIPPSVLRRATDLMRDPRAEAPVSYRHPDRWVDRSGLAGAAALLGSAIDDALPALGSSEIRGESGEGCDVVALPPLLCVAGEGPNVLSEDHALVIDLGGDDLHSHGAGAADPGNPVTGAGNGLPVSVTLDLGGNDRYAAALPASSGLKVAQGSGYVGGVGILVDAAGRDDYQVSGTGHVYGQAYGFGGAGVLADLGGDDSYSVTTRAPGGAIADGQAVSGLGGMALALDAGGDDRYEVASRSVPVVGDDDVADPGSPLALGFGVAGSGGGSLFADAGGTDEMAVRSIVGAPDPGSEIGFSSAIVDGFGFGFIGGAAAAAAGEGPTLWEAEVANLAPRNNATVAATANAMGGALSGGFGGLLDAGGDDVYRMNAAVVADHRGAAVDGCDCPVEAVADPAVAYAMGYGEAGGIGGLVDLAGADRYEAESRVTARAELADDRSDDGAAADLHATAIARDATIYAQGVGVGGGSGFLSDAAGDDVYDLRAGSSAEARVLSDHPDVGPPPTASAGEALSMGQAAGWLGHGELRDGGGLDEYVSFARSDAVSSPEGSAFTGARRSSAQASVELGGGASLLDLDGGRADAFASDPDDPACVGERGTGQWVDCGPGAGVGVNP